MQIRMEMELSAFYLVFHSNETLYCYETFPGLLGGLVWVQGGHRENLMGRGRHFRTRGKGAQ